MHRLRIKVPIGHLETVVEEPAGPPVGLALIAHPHSLKGGSLDNKVTWTLARAALHAGLVAARPNMRGVGASSGAFDHGVGEAQDLLALAASLASHYGPDLPWTLLGFSFGAYVQSRVAQTLPARRLILAGPAVSMYEFPAPAAPTTLIHGTEDEVIPYAAARAYAERYDLPLIPMEGAGHFFHGRLGELRQLVEPLCHP